MHNKTMPNGNEFIDYTKSVFNFMTASNMKQTATYYSASFKTASLGISISYDIRDNIVDCTIDELWSTDGSKLKIELPIHCNLFGFLVKHRNYRGSLGKDFNANKSNLSPWQQSVEVYANTVRNFFANELKLQ